MAATLLAKSDRKNSSGSESKTFYARRRFMRRLSVGVKLWTTTGILTIPLIGLGLFYIDSLSSTLLFTRSELRGLELFRPLHELTQLVTSHAEGAIANTTVANPGSANIAAKADAALAKLAETDAALGNDATHEQVRDLRTKWTSALASASTTPIESMKAHRPVLDAIASVRSEIGADWLIALDPELASYSLGDVTLVKLPEAVRAFSELQLRLQDLSEANGYSPEVGAGAIANSAIVRDRIESTRAELNAAAMAAKDRPLLDEITKQWATNPFVPIIGWLDRLDAEMIKGAPDRATIRALLADSQPLAQSLNETHSTVTGALERSLNIRHDSQLSTALFALCGSAFAMVLAIILMLALVRRISGAIRRLLSITQRISEGRYENAIDESGTDEISRLFAGIAHMQRTLKEHIVSEQQSSAAMARIKQALDDVSANVMVADEELDIIYVNNSTQRLFKECEQDFRTSIPNFEAARVLGANIDIFHRGAAHVRKMLQGITQTQVTNIRIGTRAVRLAASPVKDSSGKRIGTVLEWFDRTLDVNAEEELSSVITKAIEGDLSARIPSHGKSGFHAAIAQGLNQLLDNVCGIVQDVKAAAADVSRGADEISQGIVNLSNRTEQQASSLEQTASSMDEMTSTVKQNAENASEAEHLAATAREQAERGGSVTQRAVKAMNEIDESSRKIANIIGAIDEIAFQTNLLALNAAVEAARAGEQGRGFAVVASEVRSLANRSAGAAREIKALIQDSVQKVQDGSALVLESGSKLSEIVISVKKVSDIVAEIASASRDQTSGIESVGGAISQMDEMTQQNAALVEQASAASGSMADQARALNDSMGRYRLSAQAQSRTERSLAA